MTVVSRGWNRLTLPGKVVPPPRPVARLAAPTALAAARLAPKKAPLRPGRLKLGPAAAR